MLKNNIQYQDRLMCNFSKKGLLVLVVITLGKVGKGENYKQNFDLQYSVLNLVRFEV